MRVDRLEVQLARDQEDDGLDGGQSREAARTALGCLEMAVDGFEDAVGLTGPITAIEVPAGERLSFLIRRFDKHHATVELFLRSFAVELCPDFKGAQWRFFETSTGTVFMVPSGYDSLHVCIDESRFDARVSAEVAGLILSLYMLARLCDVSRSQEHMRMLVRLRNYALTNAQATTIFRILLR